MHLTDPKGHGECARCLLSKERTCSPSGKLDSLLLQDIQLISVKALIRRTVSASGSRERAVVTKKEIVKTISEECNLTQLVTKKVVQMTFEAIIETLVTEGRIELRNFGVFEVKKRAARKARNPRSGEKVFVPEKFVVTFKPGKEMEEQVLALQTSGKPLPFEAPVSLDDAEDEAPDVMPTAATVEEEQPRVVTPPVAIQTPPVEIPPPSSQLPMQTATEPLPPSDPAANS